MSDIEIPFRPMVLDEFLPLVGRNFMADCEPNSIEIRLVEATPLKHHAGTTRPPFILIFQAGYLYTSLLSLIQEAERFMPARAVEA